MLLRTRITFMVFLVSLTLIVTLAIEGNWKTALVRGELNTVRIQGQQNAWAALTHNKLQPAEALVLTAARDGSLTAALAAEDRAQLASVLQSLRMVSNGLRPDTALEVATAQGLPMAGNETGDAILSKAVVAAAERKATIVAGLFYSKSGAPVLGVVAPLYSRSGFVGAIAAIVDPQPAVKELASALGAAAILNDPAGRFSIASSADMPLALATSPARIDNGVFDLTEEKRRYRVTRTLIAPIVEGSPALLHSVQDVTDSARRDFWLAGISLLGVLSGVALALAFLDWYLRRSFRPLHQTIHMLDALARGERPIHSIATGGNDEIGRLAETATDFRKGLEARDQLLKLRQDIDVAHNIQQSILPHTPPNRDAFAVSTFMRPARDVGGDFYDYFDLPDGRFGFVIADVSGKGMGAALFMAVACTVIRSTARLVPDPGECLTRVNDLLAANNTQSMFVTVFYGVFSPDSGHVVYANGGHNPPYLLGADGRILSLPRTKGKLLAMFPNRVYSTAEITLAPGDCLYLYTDGVTEAEDSASEQFGVARLEQALQASTGRAEKVIEEVLEQVTRFVDDAAQADDITCLSLLRQGNRPSSLSEVTADS